MYNRDAVAEMKDVLGRLAESMDRLAEVHAKDRTGLGDANKELLDWLKKNGGEKKVDDTPISDARADDLTIKRTKESKASEEQGINYSTIRDVNAAFRALQGDLGGFQRTLVNAIKWGKDSQTIYDKVRSITPETMPRPMKDPSKAVELIDKLGSKEGLKAFFDLPYTGKGSPAAAAGGSVANQAAATRVGNAVNGMSVNGKIPPIPMGYPGYAEQQAAAGEAVMLSLATKVATAAAIASAPFVMAKIATHVSDNVINETRDRFGTLDPKIATGLATYDMSRLMNNLEMAPKIADSFTKVLKAREDLNKTLLPIETATTNVWNGIVTGLNKMADTALRPLSAALTGDAGRLDAEYWKDALYSLKYLTTTLPFVGVMPNLLPETDTKMDRVPGVGAARRGALNNRGIEDIVGETPAGALALQITRTPIAPPRRFVN